MTDAVVPMRRPWKVVEVVANFFNAIGPTVYGDDAATKASPNMGVISLLCLNTAVALLLIALGQGAGRRFEPALASWLVWGGIFVLVLPFVIRVATRNVSRGERLFLVILLGEALYLYTRLYSPAQFSGYDEFLHWVTAYDILHRHRLFLDNPLLPVSPFYPAMEMVTSGLGNLAGFDVFPAACMLLMLLRAIFITSLFLFIERITESSRMASIACLIYMSASTFVVFHAIYSYESMGVALVVFMMWWETRITGRTKFDASLLVPALAVMGTLAITHHASAMLCVSYMVAVTFIEALRRGFSAAKLATLASIAAVAFGFVFAWEYLPWNPVRDYLSSAFARELDEFLKVLSGTREARVPFISAGGKEQPFLNRLTGIGAVLVISICLATGFFRTLTFKASYSGWWGLLSLLRREWGDSRVLLLGVGALGFPISIVFRFSGGWEIGDRMSTWVFISASLVIAMSLVHYWESLVWWRRSCTAFVVATILFGGLVIASGPHAIHDHFEVNADEASIEPMAIGTAYWAKDWLGSGNNFGADRVNQLLLATYGDQNIVTNARTRVSAAVDVRYAFLDPTLDKNVFSVLRRGHVHYLEIDLRNAMEAPTLGDFFATGQDRSNKPLQLRALLKYETRKDVGRVYDNGFILIYNVGGLREEQ